MPLPNPLKAFPRGMGEYLPYSLIIFVVTTRCRLFNVQRDRALKYHLFLLILSNACSFSFTVTWRKFHSVIFVADIIYRPITDGLITRGTMYYEYGWFKACNDTRKQ
mgnify:CR=1 FL=1